MKFQRFNDYAEISDCGRYTISAARVLGIWVYSGWLRGSYDGQAPTLLTRHRLTFSEDARKACRRHKARTKQEAA